MDRLENRIPPPVLVIAIAISMYGASLILPLFPVNPVFGFIATLILVAIGSYLIVAGFNSFRLSKTTINPLDPGEATFLVRSGIYRISRNPMYVGMAFLLMSWSLFLSSPYTLFGALVFVLFINRFQIQPEERALTTLFGTEFVRYRIKVSRWL